MPMWEGGSIDDYSVLRTSLRPSLKKNYCGFFVCVCVCCIFVLLLLLPFPYVLFYRLCSFSVWCRGPRFELVAKGTLRLQDVDDSVRTYDFELEKNSGECSIGLDFLEGGGGWGLFFLSLTGRLGHPTWVRRLQQLLEQRHSTLPVYAIFTVYWSMRLGFILPGQPGQLFLLFFDFQLPGDLLPVRPSMGPTCFSSSSDSKGLTVTYNFSLVFPARHRHGGLVVKASAS